MEGNNDGRYDHNSVDFPLSSDTAGIVLDRELVTRFVVTHLDTAIVLDVSLNPLPFTFSGSNWSARPTLTKTLPSKEFLELKRSVIESDSHWTWGSSGIFYISPSLDFEQVVDYSACVLGQGRFAQKLPPEAGLSLSNKLLDRLETTLMDQ